MGQPTGRLVTFNRSNTAALNTKRLLHKVLLPKLPLPKVHLHSFWVGLLVLCWCTHSWAGFNEFFFKRTIRIILLDSDNAYVHGMRPGYLAEHGGPGRGFRVMYLVLDRYRGAFTSHLPTDRDLSKVDAKILIATPEDSIELTLGRGWLFDGEGFALLSKRDYWILKSRLDIDRLRKDPRPAEQMDDYIFGKQQFYKETSITPPFKESSLVDVDVYEKVYKSGPSSFDPSLTFDQKEQTKDEPLEPGEENAEGIKDTDVGISNVTVGTGTKGGAAAADNNRRADIVQSASSPKTAQGQTPNNHSGDSNTRPTGLDPSTLAHGNARDHDPSPGAAESGRGAMPESPNNFAKLYWLFGLIPVFGVVYIYLRTKGAAS